MNSMKKRQKHSTSAWTLQITLTTALISISAILLASSFKASPQPSDLYESPDSGAPHLLSEFAGLKTVLISPWTRTTNNPPVNLGTTLLLTDGTVIAHEENDQNNNVATRAWYKLTPDINGSYINGTWSQIASLPVGYGPLFFGSAVLPDGRVVVEGGEYNQYGGGFTRLGAIYDPVADTWTSVTAPTGWNTIGDASTVVLSSGQLMLANTVTVQAALFNPSSLTWTATGSGKFDVNDEEGWTLLPNGKVLTIDAYVQHYQSSGMNYELYDPVTGTWSVAGTTPVQLWDSAANCGGQSQASFEVGPALLLPNGTVFATGANSCGPGHTAIYHTNSGTWTAGPDFPGNLDIADGPAALEPNGKMLMMTSPLIFGAGAVFFEWEGSTLTQVPGPPNAPNVSSFQGHLLVLPTGQIMYTDYTNDVEIFTPIGGNYDWVPSASFPYPTDSNHSQPVLLRGHIYLMVGLKLNGLSQATAYGDDLQNATNYPIVRLTNIATGHVFYCRTHGHSTMAVGYTGQVTTQVDIPANMETGPSRFEVVANGIPSVPYTLQVR